MSKVSVIARFFPKTGADSQVEQILRGMVAPTRGEPGCERYDLYRAKDATSQFVLFESYRDQSALDAHRATAHYKNYRAAIADLLADPIGVTVLEALDAA